MRVDVIVDGRLLPDEIRPGRHECEKSGRLLIEVAHDDGRLAGFAALDVPVARAIVVPVISVSREKMQ